MLLCEAMKRLLDSIRFHYPDGIPDLLARIVRDAEFALEEHHKNPAAGLVGIAVPQMKHQVITADTPRNMNLNLNRANKQGWVLVGTVVPLRSDSTTSGTRLFATMARVEIVPVDIDSPLN